MVRQKIKGNKVRSKPTEEPDFYNPLWKTYFGTTVPDELKAKAFNKIGQALSPKTVPQLAPFVTSSMNAPKKQATSTETLCVDILPAPAWNETFVPVSDEESSWDSIDLDALDDDLFLGEDPFRLEEFGDPNLNANATVDSYPPNPWMGQPQAYWAI